MTSPRLYVYADETSFRTEPGQPETIGTGLLVTRTPIRHDLVTAAMDALRTDPDRLSASTRRHDDRTLSSGFFHASADSRNGHSHLCREVAKLDADFIHSCYRTDQDPRREASDDAEWTARATLRYGAAFMFLSPEPVHLLVEQRTGFGKVGAEAVVEALRGNVEWMIYDQPDLPLHFPHVEVEVLGKEQAGLQAADFVLWAVNRTLRATPDPLWVKRLGLATISRMQPNNGLSGGMYRLGRGVGLQARSYPAEVLPVRQPVGNDGLWTAYVGIERMVRGMAAETPSPHVQHLRPRLAQAAGRAGQSEVKACGALVDEFASLYLRLFDTVPCYPAPGEHCDQQWRTRLTQRWVAALLVRRDLSHGSQSHNFLARCRHTAMLKEPWILDPFAPPPVGGDGSAS